MIEVIKAGKMKGKLDTPIYFKCPHCECIFTADEDDDYDYEVDLVPNKEYYTTVCPWCGTKVYKDAKTVR